MRKNLIAIVPKMSKESEAKSARKVVRPISPNELKRRAEEEQMRESQMSMRGEKVQTKGTSPEISLSQL